jgi:hypothetical protein
LHDTDAPATTSKSAANPHIATTPFPTTSMPTLLPRMRKKELQRGAAHVEFTTASTPRTSERGLESKKYKGIASTK